MLRGCLYQEINQDIDIRALQPSVSGSRRREAVPVITHCQREVGNQPTNATGKRSGIKKTGAS